MTEKMNIQCKENGVYIFWGCSINVRYTLIREFEENKGTSKEKKNWQMKKEINKACVVYRFTNFSIDNLLFVSRLISKSQHGIAKLYGDYIGYESSLPSSAERQRPVKLKERIYEKMALISGCVAH